MYGLMRFPTIKAHPDSSHTKDSPSTPIPSQWRCPQGPMCVTIQTTMGCPPRGCGGWRGLPTKALSSALRFFRSRPLNTRVVRSSLLLVNEKRHTQTLPLAGRLSDVRLSLLVQRYHPSISVQHHAPVATISLTDNLIHAAQYTLLYTVSSHPPREVTPNPANPGPAPPTHGVSVPQPTTMSTTAAAIIAPDAYGEQPEEGAVRLDESGTPR
jgi:hypothetical protein